MLKAILTIDRLDKDGRLLERRRQASRSFVALLIKMLYVHFNQFTEGAPYAIGNDLDGVARNADAAWDTSAEGVKGTYMMCAAGGGSLIVAHNGRSGTNPRYFLIDSQKLGVLVGTGVAAVAPTDTNLATRIIHGRAAGQLEYGGSEVINLVAVNPNASFDLRRYFTNLSGGAITVNEVGISAAATVHTNTNPAACPFLICRDLVAGGVTVNNNELLRATYTIQITV